MTPSTKCIMMLHGVWSNESDLLALSKHFPEEYLIISLRWPFSLWNGRFAWYPVDFSSGKPVYTTQDVETWYREIITCIDEVSLQFDIHPKNIFLMGFSQGAMMSFYTLWRSPEKIGGMIALSWRLLAEIDTDTVDEDEYRGKRIFNGMGLMMRWFRWSRRVLWVHLHGSSVSSRQWSSIR